MSDIPVVFAASDSWKKKFSGQWEQLVNNRKKISMTWFLLGLMGLESIGIDTKNDLGSEDYEGVYAPETLHGRVNLKDKRNYFLWQRTNAPKTIFLPHRVNTRRYTRPEYVHLN